MELFTSDWSSCFVGNVSTGEGVASLACIWIVLKNLINTALVFAGIVAVFLIVYSGFQFVTSQGDKEKISGAQKRLTWAIIGLIFIVSSFLIITFISQFTGVGLSQLGTPPADQPNLIPNQ